MEEFNTPLETLKLKKTIKGVVWRHSSRGIEFLALQLNQEEAEAEGRVGEWHLLGGGQDDEDDDDIYTLKREGNEETKLNPDFLIVGKLVHQDEWDGYYEGKPGFHYIANFYSCQYTGPDVPLRLSREHDDAGWFLKSELPVGLTPEARQAIEVVSSDFERTRTS